MRLEKRMKKEQNRGGMTKVTSVSISKEFREIIENNNVSPTEIFRKGLIIEAYERGIDIPNINMGSPLIQRRIKIFKDTGGVIELEHLEDSIKELESKLMEFRMKLIRIKKAFS